MNDIHKPQPLMAGGALNQTHDASALSWLNSANSADSDFPIQNLPFSVFRRKGSNECFRGGTAIGDQVIDLAALSQTGTLNDLAQLAANACSQSSLNAFFSSGPEAWSALRNALFLSLNKSANSSTQTALRQCLIPQDQIEFDLPAHIGDYTDFYTSINHAKNAGQLVRPDTPLFPNFQWLPVAYHGRASSIILSGQNFHRPNGQSMKPGATQPSFGPCARLDFELELAAFIGTGNPLGQPITLADAERHIFGLCLLNDWSARDIQFWEMTPLGPFSGKNFATSISPWIVTMEALLPFRQAWSRPPDHPQPLPYLDTPGNRVSGALDIQLSAGIETPFRRRSGLAPAIVSQTSFVHQYWTLGQMVTQHTAGGCNLKPGDLIGTGTISGPTPTEAGALLELTQGGKVPLQLKAEGFADEQRCYLEDGDAVVFNAWCEKAGFRRIGFGANRNEVLPALAAV